MNSKNEFIETFSYVFNEDVERLFSFLTNEKVLYELIFNSSVNKYSIDKTNVKNVNSFEGLKIYFNWNNKYKCEVEVYEVDYNLIVKKIGLKFIKIDNYKNPLILNYYYYWNSCETNTFLRIEIITFEKFHYEKLKTEFSQEFKLQLCKKIENYLKYDYNNLIQFDSILIEKPLKEIYNKMKEINKFISFFLSPNLIIESSIDFSYGSILRVFDINNNVKFIYKLKGIFISNNRICVNIDKIDEKGNKILTAKLMVDKLDNNICIYFIHHFYSVYVNSQEIWKLSKKKKNCLKFFKKFMENNLNKDDNNIFYSNDSYNI